MEEPEEPGHDGQSVLTARGARNFHGVLLAGNVILAIAFELSIRFDVVPPVDVSGIVVDALLGAVLLMLLVATFWLRPRIPRRSPARSRDGYWGDQLVGARAMQFWQLLEGAGTVALVGYLLTGDTAVAAMALCAIATFAFFRPARLEG